MEKEYADKEMDEALEEEMGEEIDEIEECLEFIEKIIKNANGIQQFEALKSYFPKEYEFENWSIYASVLKNHFSLLSSLQLDLNPFSPISTRIMLNMMLH